MFSAYHTKGAKETTPTLDPSSPVQLPESTNCLACSDDGNLLSVGHCRGLSVWCASSLSCTAEWLQDKLEITSVQMTNMAESSYLLGSIDDMGVARIFAYHSETVHLLHVINPMVFSIPTEAWLKELEVATSQKQDKWSPVSLAVKTKPPRTPAGSARDSQTNVSILSHYLALDEKSDTPKTSTHHFLLPCGQLTGDIKAKSGLPVAICMWWSGSCSLLQCLLQRGTKTKSDVDQTADITWPNAKQILCSAVSRCTRFIALGLSDSMVCVWDRLSGSPLSVATVAVADSPFCGLQFVADAAERAACTEQVHLVLVCKSGAIQTVAAGPGIKPLIEQLTERPKETGDLPTCTAAVPFLQGSVLVVHRNGKMYLKDGINKTDVCILNLPATHLLATPCSPVYAFNTKQRLLLIRGDPDPSISGSAKGASQLFIFRFGECFFTLPFLISLQESPWQQKPLSFAVLEEACNLYLKERALSGAERCEAIKQTWNKLQETPVITQQRRERRRAR